MPEVQAVGIDLGTTYSAVAHIDAGGHSAMIRNSEGELLTPSVVHFDADEVIVGRAAKKALATAPDSVADCAKRDIGLPAYFRPINGEQVPPEVIEACILRKLKRDTVSTLGSNLKVVITVPAFFDEPRRKATADAGEMAGLDVLNIVNEPTAAALAFGEQLGYLTQSRVPRAPMRVLVYDLGGGTFDVTLIDLKPGAIITLATDGDVRLGGYDWDTRLAAHAAEAFKQLYQVDLRENSAGHSKLQTAIEETKHTLTVRERAVVHLEFEGKVLDVPVTRALFEELTSDLLERTMATTRQVLSCANLNWSDITRILLVGGSTRMPMVAKRLEAISGIVPDCSVNPDEAVARGAALFADYLLTARGERSHAPHFDVVDVNAHSLGIEGIDQRTTRKENVVIIPRNTPLPAQATRKFVTKMDSQKSVVIQVLEGESQIPEWCSPIGRAVIRNLPAGLPQGSQIDVVYQYATNGRLSVHARLAVGGSDALIELERDRGLSSTVIGAWKRIVCSDGGFAAFKQELNAQAAHGATAAAAGGVAARPIPVVGSATVPSATAAVAATIAMAGAAAPVGFKPGAPMATPQPAPALAPALAPSSPVSGSQTILNPRPAIPAAVAPVAAQVASAPAQYGSAAGESNSSLPAKRKLYAEMPIVNLLGHAVAAFAGLAAGYYLLCFIRPQANFLHINLPGISQPEDSLEAPASSPSNSPSNGSS